MAVWMQTTTERYRALPTRRSVRVSGRALAGRAQHLIVAPKRASVHLAVAVLVAALSGLPGGDASLLLFGWLALATMDVAFTAGWKRMLSGHGEDADFTPPPASGIVMTGSISSTVKLDYDAGTAEKTYAPGAFVRGLYRLAFQAPFPYTSQPAAARAAQHRRSVIGLLTQYWYGENLVAPVLEVRTETDGRITFVSELVRGTAPRDLPRAKALLADLTERFLESGLPSWQVGSYNPRSIGNLIQRDDGTFRIIDLESNLVTPILPPKAAVRAIREGLYPSFDEIDTRRLDAYLDTHRESIRVAIGEADAERLFVAAAGYAEAQTSWHNSEPRIASKMIKFAFRLVDVPSWLRAVRRLTEGSEQLAENFTTAGIETWVQEGRLSEDEAAEIRASLALPEVASATAHLGTHMAMSVPLRFPLGSIARSGWTLAMRARGEWMALRGHGSAGSVRQVHSLAVAVVAGIPGLGTFAYTLAKPLRQQRALSAIALDQLLRHLSMRVYRGAHFDSLTLWMAQPLTANLGSFTGRVVAQIRGRVRAICGTLQVAGLVLLVNVALVTAAVAIDSSQDLIRAALLGQVLVASAAGAFAFRNYWQRGAVTDLSEASGIFFWGAAAAVLAVVGVDYGLGVHEAVFGFTAEHVNVFAMVTDPSEHLIMLGYLTIAGPFLFVLRHELGSTRASATWALVALGAGAVLVASGSFAVLSSAQAYAQAVTGAALTLAFVSRLVEVTALRRDDEALSPLKAEAPSRSRNLVSTGMPAGAS